jgi:hypothetical protein
MFLSLIKQYVSKKANQRTFNPFLAIDKYKDEDGQEEKGNDEEGEGNASQRLYPIDARKGEIKQESNAQQ